MEKHIGYGENKICIQVDSLETPPTNTNTQSISNNIIESSDND